MKLAIMQAYFLPYIGYFQAIDAVDKYILYSDVNFSKKGWMNRNRLLMKDGSIFTITAPIIRKSSRKLINSIKIDKSIRWKSKLLRTIYTSYKGSAFFDEVYPFLESIFSPSFEYLYQLNGYLIENICTFIGIDTIIEYENSDMYAELEEKLLDIVESNYLKFQYMEKTRPDTKVARILEICKSENANIYVNAIGGQSLYSKEEFAKYGVDLKFIEMQEFNYQQFSQDFEPNLSIIDVLMHNGSTGTKSLIKKYTLL